MGSDRLDRCDRVGVLDLGAETKETRGIGTFRRGDQAFEEFLHPREDAGGGLERRIAGPLRWFELDL